MNKKIIWIIVFLLVIAVGYRIVYRPTTEGAGVIKVGVLYAQTGPAAKFGELSVQGARDAAEYFKQTTGKDVNLFVEDTASDPKQAVSAAQKLFSVDGVGFVITGTSAVTAAVAPVAEAAHAILITDAAAYGLTKDKKYVFPSLGDFAQRVNRTSEWKKIAVLYINDEFGVKWDTSIKNTIDASKEVMSFPFEKDQKDFRTDALKMKSFNPDVVIVIGYGPALNISLESLYAQKVNNHAVFLVYLGCTLPGVLTDPKFNLDGQFSYEIPTKISSNFGQFMSSKNASANAFYRIAFENMLVALTAAQKNDGDPTKAAEYLRAEGVPGLVYGDVHFSSEDYVERDLVLTKISNGQCVPVDN